MKQIRKEDINDENIVEVLEKADIDFEEDEWASQERSQVILVIGLQIS